MYIIYNKNMNSILVREQFEKIERLIERFNKLVFQSKSPGRFLPRTFVIYILWKMGIRFIFGKTLDSNFTKKYGWGKDSYITAIIHQFGIIILGCWIAYEKTIEETDFNKWLNSILDENMLYSDYYKYEGVFTSMMLSEMATDCFFNSGYPGFDISYLLHHIFTFLSTFAFSIYPGLPIGYLILWGTAMETGSFCFTMASIHRCFFKNTSPILYTYRNIGFLTSRLVATIILAMATKSILNHPNPKLIGPTFSWIVMFVNYNWIFKMILLHIKVKSVECLNIFDLTLTFDMIDN